MITLRTPVCEKGHFLVPKLPESEGFTCAVCNGNPVTLLEAGEEWAPKPEFKWMPLPYEKLNPVQAEVSPWSATKTNLVIAAATSAGKTLMAEMCIAPIVQPLQKRGETFRPKAIYLAPLKALAQEKLDDWTSPSHPFSKLQICIATGDTMVGSARERILRSCASADIMCMTSEMLDSLTRRMQAENNSWLNDVRVVVVDESHLLTMEERGDKLESALMRFSLQNPRARLVLLSATMPNVQDLGSWVHTLNSLPTVVISSSWRPVQLDVHYEPHPAEKGWASYQKNREAMLDKVMQIYLQNSKHRALIFVHSKADGYFLAKKFAEQGVIAEFHNADLDRTSRNSIEKRFRDKGSALRVVIATSTLAYGLNLPARIVIIAGSKRGIQYVHPYDIRQEIGRSGRFGIDEKGDAFIVLPEPDLEKEKERLENLPPIESNMEREKVLYFHLIAEIAEGYHVTPEALLKWHQRSLAHVRGKPLDPGSLQEILDEFISEHLIKVQEDGTLKATGLGRVASWLYYHPLDVSGWEKNFYLARTRNLLDKDVAVAWALARVPGSWTEFIPKALKEYVEEFQGRCSDLRLPIGNDAVAGYGYYLALTCSDSKIPPGWQMEVRGVRMEAERLLQAISLIDSHHSRWGESSRWNVLATRMKYGVPADVVGLLAIPGIGAERSLRLRSAGIKTVEAVCKAGLGSLVKLLGKKLGTSVLAEANRLAKRKD